MHVIGVLGIMVARIGEYATDFQGLVDIDEVVIGGRICGGV